MLKLLFSIFLSRRIVYDVPNNFRSILSYAADQKESVIESAHYLFITKQENFERGSTTVILFIKLTITRLIPIQPRGIRVEDSRKNAGRSFFLMNCNVIFGELHNIVVSNRIRKYKGGHSRVSGLFNWQFNSEGMRFYTKVFFMVIKSI